MSHSLPTLTTLCDRGLWLDHSQVVKAGRVGPLIEQYTQSLETRLASSAEAR